MNKCFTSIFTEPLEKEGFARKGVLYYRLRGDVMQGVMLKTTNPFSICVNMCPWWTYGLMGYDAVRRGGLDTPRTLYEQGTAGMRELLRSDWKIEI